MTPIRVLLEEAWVDPGSRPLPVTDENNLGRCTCQDKAERGSEGVGEAEGVTLAILLTSFFHRLFGPVPTTPASSAVTPPRRRPLAGAPRSPHAFLASADTEAADAWGAQWPSSAKTVRGRLESVSPRTPQSEPLGPRRRPAPAAPRRTGSAAQDAGARGGGAEGAGRGTRSSNLRTQREVETESTLRRILRKF